MNIPTATAYEADKVYADARFYSLEGIEGFFRRVKKPGKGTKLACYDTDALRTGHFIEVFASELSDTPGKPDHAPGPNARIEKPELVEAK